MTDPNTCCITDHPDPGHAPVPATQHIGSHRA